MTSRGRSPALVSLARSIATSGIGLALGLAVTPCFAEQTSSVRISSLVVSNAEGALHRAARVGERVWGVAVIANTGDSDAQLRWQMILDGKPVSGGVWTVEPGQTAVGATPSSETLSAGFHMLAVMVGEGADVIAQTLVSFEVKDAAQRH